MRVKIQKNADLRWDADAGVWTTLAPLRCVIVGSHVAEIVVPKDFQCDLASIPRIFRSITPQVGKHIGAAVVHDYCYQTGCVSRKEADRIFLAAMESLGVYWLRRKTMHLAVRLFGRWSYKG